MALRVFGKGWMMFQKIDVKYWGEESERRADEHIIALKEMTGVESIGVVRKVSQTYGYHLACLTLNGPLSSRMVFCSKLQREFFEEEM